MAFFEQLGKKLTDAGQGVAQQTKNMAEVARINGAISDKRKQIAANLTAIGEAYYNAHRDDPDAEQANLITAITNLYAEIAQCEDDIKTIRGITKCPKCGADVPINSAFCSVCGAQMAVAPTAPATAPEGMRECPGCHAYIPEGNKFCTKCGTKLE